MPVVAEVVVLAVVVVVLNTNKTFMTPNKITIQWHITDICNLRCKHCYQDSYLNDGGDLQHLLKYYEKIENFILHLNKNNEKLGAHINFTGGEPFIKKNFLDLLEVVNSRGFFTFGILTNGFLLQKDELLRLKSFKPSFIQISLDGNKPTHDYIREKGSLQWDWNGNRYSIEDARKAWGYNIKNGYKREI